MYITGSKIRIGEVKETDKRRMRFLFVLRSHLTGYYRPVVASNIKHRSEQIAKSAGFPVGLKWRTLNKIDNGYEILEEIKKSLPGRSIGDWFDCSWEEMAASLRKNGLTV